MMFNCKLLICCSLLSLSVKCANLPDYFTLCKKSSGDNKCFLGNAQIAIERLGKDNGDPKLKVNGLKPVKIEVIDLQATPQLKVVLNDCDFFGFDDFKFTDASFTENELKLTGYSEKLELLSKYDVKGQILILPIEGVGDMNVTTVKTKIIYTAKLDKIEKDGKSHFKIESSTVSFKPERMYFYLNNLFNGDERLGTEMNKFLNEGWAEVFEEIQGAVELSIASIFDKFIAIYFEKLSADQILGD